MQTSPKGIGLEKTRVWLYTQNIIANLHEIYNINLFTFPDIKSLFYSQQNFIEVIVKDTAWVRPSSERVRNSKVVFRQREKIALTL